MTEQNKTENKNTQNNDFAALLKAQEEKFIKQMKEQNNAMQEKINAMEEQNKKLTEELTNLKTNTEQENALLGEKIAKVTGIEEEPKYNPFDKSILYNVENEVAGITTVMTGDEVKGIIGSIDKHLRLKLVQGAKNIEKHPYKITKKEEKK